MFGFIGNIGPWELVLILFIALVVVGPGKLPEVAKSLGKGMNEFKKATSGVKKEFEDAMKVDDQPSFSTTVKPTVEPEVIETTATKSSVEDAAEDK